MLPYTPHPAAAPNAPVDTKLPNTCASASRDIAPLQAATYASPEPKAIKSINEWLYNKDNDDYNNDNDDDDDDDNLI